MLDVDSIGRRTQEPFLLLEHMGEFVCHKPLARRRTGLEVSVAEHDGAPDREGLSLDGMSQAACLCTYMDPYLAEIMSETRLEEGTG